jgi:PIN domain nuclease of toxin-antitoxin system
MRYLLDTHTIIWYFEGSPRLPSRLKEIIDNSGNSVYICSVSPWEIAIKVSSGKLKLRFIFEEFLDKIKVGTFDLLQIENEHLKRLAVLPFLHRDPFDRQLIATAQAENLTIITADEGIHQYDVPWIW